MDAYFFSINIIIQYSKLKSHSHQASNSKMPGNKQK